MRVLNQRGSALLTAVVVIVVVTVIGIGVIRFASREVAGASAGANQASLAACAEAGRNLIRSRFILLGARPERIEALNETLDGRTRVVGGHYGEDYAGAISDVQLAQVTKLPPFVLGRATVSGDITNIITRFGSGGASPYKVVVHCQQGQITDPGGGRQLEVEFAVEFGL